MGNGHIGNVYVHKVNTNEFYRVSKDKISHSVTMLNDFIVYDDKVVFTDNDKQRTAIKVAKCENGKLFSLITEEDLRND